MKNVKRFIFIQILIVISLLLIEKFLVNSIFSFDRLLVLYMVFGFISLHCFINPKRIWLFIYKWRYIIAIVLLIFCVVNKYHRSSLGIWNDVIPSENAEVNYTPFLGFPRSIRSDEWMVSTPSYLSQVVSSNPLSYKNNIIMGGDRIVTMFPCLPSNRINTITSLFTIGYSFLSVEYAFSFQWMSKVILLFLVSFDFCMIITKKNKLCSLLGMFIIGFAPCIHWWSNIEMIIWGEAAICCLYGFLKSTKKRIKFIWTILFSLSCLNYLFTLYPAWQIAFGYLYAMLGIIIIIQNKKNLKWNNIFYLLLIISIIFGAFIPIWIQNKEIIQITMNTSYPGARFSIGGEGWQLLFNYFSTIFYPFKLLNNPSENAQFLSLYPLPLIIGMIYSIKYIKTKKFNIMILSLCILSIFLSLWNYLPLPKIIAKYSLLYLSTPYRTHVVVSYIMALLIVLILSNYCDSKIFKSENKSIIFSTFVVSLLVSLGIHSTISVIDTNYMSATMIIISSVVFSLLMILFISNKKETNKIFIILFCIISFFAGGTISPFTRGLSVVYDKPLSKAVQSISKKVPDAKWISLDNWHLQNYIIMNGASTINSTNYYPNLKLWSLIDPEEKYKDIYNRYAHIVISFTDEESYFELNYQDSITLHLNQKEVCKLGINYIVTTTNLELNDIIVDKPYSEFGINIYKTSCEVK